MEILELKSTITELKKKSPEGINSRFELEKLKSSKIEDRSIDIMQAWEHREERIKHTHTQHRASEKCRTLWVHLHTQKERKGVEK